MWIGKNEDNTVAVANTQVDATWVEVDSLPDEQDVLVWNDADPKNPTADQEKVFTKQAHALTSTVSNLLDTKAQEFRYDDMKSARSYAGYVNDFQTEALSLGQWASACWVYMDGVEADVLAQTRTIPTVDELLAELPAYTPPV